jgi:outer membrane receptor protein involved in Fe transport
VESVVVTGSHIATGLVSPTPVTEVSAEQLAKASPATLASQMRQIPALMNTIGPHVYPGVRSGGQSFLNLRGLDPVRTLTLLDGQRVVPTGLFGTVDLNMIPSVLVQRVDVVTGGASAAYGSDAVAGVVNFILDSRFEGLKGNLGYGLTNHGDNGETVGSVAAGTSFADGRGHLVASAEYFQQDGIKGGRRGWQARSLYVIPNPSGQPNYVLAPHVTYPITYGGLITGGLGGTPAANAAFKGIMFGPGGVPEPYSYGTLTTSGAQSGGDGLDTGSYPEFERPLKRYTVFTRGSFDLTDHLTVTGDILFGQSSTDYLAGPQQHLGATGLTISRDNAYLPASIRSQMVALGLTGFTFTRADSEDISRLNHALSTARATLGFKADLGPWKANGYYEHGENRERIYLYNNEVKAKYSAALDSVINPATGLPICRSTLTDPNNGCAPFNPFGVGSPSQAALAYVDGAATQLNHTKEDAAGLNLAGDLLNLPAGPLAVAVGGEVRRESIVSQSDAYSQQNALRLGNFLPWRGAYDIREAYVEAEVPLLRDLPFVRALSINAAGRLTNYSNSGDAKTWKVGAVWEPTSDLRLRVTRSHDIRAPNLNDLYSPGQRSSAAPVDPFKGGAQLSVIDVFVTGNPDLKPEVGDTFTAGVVYQPSFVRGFSATLDYYQIKVDGLIATVPVQTKLNQCFIGVNLDCASLHRDAGGNLVRIDQRAINFSSLQTSGLDLEVEYAPPLAEWIDGWRGDLSVRALANYTRELKLASPGAPEIDYAGYTGGLAQPPVTGAGNTPHVTGQVQVRYDLDAWSFLAQVRIVGSGDYFNAFAPKTMSLTKVAGRQYLDLNFERRLEALGGGAVYLNVRNVFDKDPPLDPAPGGLYETNTTLFDQDGRVFRVGVRFKY